MKIALIIPTIRIDSYREFMVSWQPLIDKYDVDVVSVFDGDEPVCNDKTIEEIMGKEKAHLIFNKSDVVRNLGFVYAKKYINPDYYLTLDDDLDPSGDSVKDHLDALESRFPSKWMSTATEYVRGVPYGIRGERECVVSHGVWDGVYDYDAPTQLVRGNPHLEFYKGAIPHGVYFPFCGMNVMFKAKMLPYMYFAPMGYRAGLDRFGDIWLGIHLKRYCDENNLSIATGYSHVIHKKASNVFTNLVKEAKGITMNESLWKDECTDPYILEYDKLRKEWEEYIISLD